MKLPTIVFLAAITLVLALAAFLIAINPAYAFDHGFNSGRFLTIP